MKAVIYARYSCENQREESIEGQIRECKEYAKRNNIEIIGEYIDRAKSARTAKRPDFQRMITDSYSKTFDAVLVWKFDRFSRSRLDSLTYKALLKANNVRLISANEASIGGAAGVFFESLIDAQAEFYSLDLSEKVVRGMKENALKCKYNGGGHPIGYFIDDEKHFQIDPLIAPNVLDAFKMYNDGMSMKEVADELNMRGVRTNAGKKLTIDSMTRMLHNRKYIGEYSFRDIVIPNGIPQIVPEDLFNSVQERMAKTKKAPARYKAEDEYLLSTKLFCGKCKGNMVGESGTSSTGNVYRYYKCANVKNHKGCDKKSVPKIWIENLVISEIQKIILDDDLLDEIADKAIALLKSENSALPTLKKQLQKVIKSIENLINAIEMGIITDSTKERLEALEHEKAELNYKIAKEENEHPFYTKDEITYWLRKFRKLDITTLSSRRKLINTFVNAVFLYDDKLVITFNYKDGGKDITFDQLEESFCRSDTSVSGGP